MSREHGQIICGASEPQYETSNHPNQLGGCWNGVCISAWPCTRPSQGLAPSPLSRASWESTLELSPEHWNNTSITGLTLNYLHSAPPAPHRDHFAMKLPSLKGFKHLPHSLLLTQDAMAAICQCWHGSPCTEQRGIPCLRSIPTCPWLCQVGIWGWQQCPAVAVGLAGKGEALEWH